MRMFVAALAVAFALLLVPSAEASPRTFHTLVLLGEFANYPSQYITPAQANAYVFTNSDSLAAFESAVSYGQFTVQGEVHGWYTIPAAISNCDFTTWSSELEAAAEADGVNVAAFDHVIYNFSAGPGCAPAAAMGGGDLTSGHVWIYGPKMVNAAGGQALLEHEFGHAIGLAHAGQTDCFAGCVRNDTGDAYDVMGNGAAAETGYNGSYRAELGMLPVTPVGQSGIYTLQRLASSNGDRVLQVQRGDGSRVEVDYRNGGLFEPADATVGVRLVASGDAGQSFLVLAEHQGYRIYDPQSMTLIQNVASGTMSAQVSVQVGVPAPAPDTTAPSAPTLIGAKGGTKGQPVENLSWTAATDNVAVTGYNIYGNGTLWERDYADQTSSQQFLPKKGSVTFCVKAVDQAGNEGACSNMVS